MRIHPNLGPFRLGVRALPESALLICGLATGRIDTEGLRFAIQPATVEQLNEWAGWNHFDAVMVSVPACLTAADRLRMLPGPLWACPTGGPSLVARQPIRPEALAGRTVLVPGEGSAGFMALSLLLPPALWEIHPEGQLRERLLEGIAPAGLVLGRDRLEYPHGEGLHPLVDISEWWGRRHGGMPLPLGVFALDRCLDPEVGRRFARVLRRSIDYGLGHRADVLQYALQWARPMSGPDVTSFLDRWISTELILDPAHAKNLIDAFCHAMAAEGREPARQKPHYLAD